MSQKFGLGLLILATIGVLGGPVRHACSATSGHSERLGVAGSLLADHMPGYDDPLANGCADCHGNDLKGYLAPSCFKCHGAYWDSNLPQYPDWHTIDITGNGHGAPQPDCTLCHNPHNGLLDRTEFWHGPGFENPLWSNCDRCHGSNLDGIDGFALSCYSCHNRVWAGQGPPPDHTDLKFGFAHKPGGDDPFGPDGCTTCHGSSLNNGFAPSCFECHGPGGGLPLDHTLWISGVSHKPGNTLPWESGCTQCHGPNLNDGWAPSCFTCHQATWDDHDFSDRAWLAATNPCYVCHLPPAFDPGNATSDPVWNHDPAPASGYDVTTGTTAFVGQPAGVSLKCLGCHAGDPDGAGGNPAVGPAVDAFGGGPGVPSEWVSGPLAFGLDLWRHHPVSFLYDDNVPGLYPLAAPSGLTRTGTIAEDMLDETGQLQCTGCHNQHDNALGEYLVKTKEMLCFTCHTFVAAEGSHHIPGRDTPWNEFRCNLCHGSSLGGTPAEGGDGVALACTSCHSPFTDPDPPPAGHHGGERFVPYFDCSACHADPLTGVVTGNDFGVVRAPSCYDCHEDLWNIGNTPPDGLSVAGTELRDTDGDNVPDTPTLYGTLGEALAFVAEVAANDEGDPLAYQWSFGDGSPPPMPSHEAKTAHTYGDYYNAQTNSQVFKASVSVTDGVNPPIYYEFDVIIADREDAPGVDRWTITPSSEPAFVITLENYSGALVAVRDGGQLAYGVEYVGVIFWMDLWMDLSESAFWGVGDMYFGNIDRDAGTMTGVVFDVEGGVATFDGTAIP